MADAYSLIRDAVLNKKTVVATYDGYERRMCPHVLGTTKGQRQGLFYQFAGNSRRGLEADGSPANWRCVRISRLSNVRIEDG
ncbi:MAG: hypothetical protein KY475_26400, partial [Planctomycetes bacterium]|nr:hypothetical protein [Planctomycetota bacterium]